MTESPRCVQYLLSKRRQSPRGSCHVCMHVLFMSCTPEYPWVYSYSWVFRKHYKMLLFIFISQYCKDDPSLSFMTWLWHRALNISGHNYPCILLLLQLDLIQFKTEADQSLQRHMHAIRKCCLLQGADPNTYPPTTPSA